MKNKKIEGSLLILSGIVIACAALYIYFFVNKTYPDSASSRVRQINWLLDNLGKLPPMSILFLVGLIPVYTGLRKFKN